jgi:hypothetical protein
MTMRKYSAEETYLDLETEVDQAHKELMQISVILGRWHASRQDPYLRDFAYHAEGLEIIARRIKRLAEEQIEQP